MWTVTRTSERVKGKIVGLVHSVALLQNQRNFTASRGLATKCATRGKLRRSGRARSKAATRRWCGLRATCFAVCTETLYSHA